MSRDSRSAAMKAEAADLCSRIADAQTKDEALDLAIHAAELCMKALKLASDESQRADISARCQTLLTEAERIKKATDWPSPVPGNSSCTSSARYATDHSTGSNKLTEVTVPVVKPASKALKNKRLREPTSDRVLPRLEQILLLKASKLNGLVFPPWKDAPDASEFTLGCGEGPFKDDAVLRLSPHQLQSFNGWKHAKHALPPPAWLPSGRDRFGPTMHANHLIDLVQDAATDCSVVASLCAGISRVERGNETLLVNIIWPYDEENTMPKLSENGKYVMRLNFNGCWRRVVVDDRLPVSKTSRMLHVVDRKNPALLWPALLEKAYLKVRGGYDFPGSSSCTDLWTLVGWIPEQIFLQDEDNIPSELWTRLFNAFNYGDVLVTVGTGSMSHHAEKELGLEGQHNYAVLDMRETGDEKQLLLKNPWAEGKGWRDVRKESFAIKNAIPPDTSPSADEPNRTFPSSARSSQDLDHLAPGTFWINLEHVFQHFDHIYLNWNPALFKYRQDIHFAWDFTSSSNAPGCLVDNPQFSLTTDGDEPMWLLLSRHFQNRVGNTGRKETSVSDDARDGAITADNGSHSTHPGSDVSKSNSGPQTRTEPSDLGDLVHGYISLYIYDQAGTRVYTNGMDAVERGAFVSTAQMLLKWKNPSKSTYTVVVEQMDLPPSQYTFTLSTLSLKPVKLDHATSRYANTTKLQSSWNKTTAGGNLQSPAFSKNPQFSLRIPQTASLAILLQVPSMSVVSNVVLLHGQGKRVYSVKNRDIVTNSGVYKKGCAFAELQNINPGIYTIACSTFETGQEASFELRVDSSVKCELKPIPQEGAGQVSMKLTPACFSPTTNTVAAPIIPRKLARVTIVARFLRAYGTHHIPDTATRSPLRVTLEHGRAPERRILIASCNGEYSDSEAGVRTEEVDLSLSMLHTGDMWLVLDRLSGPATDCSEVFQVELFCDTPNALSVGVWRGWNSPY